MACRLAILGDSSSSGIGLGRCCYPAQVFRILRAEREVHVFNYAVPGFTSADASRFFHTIAATHVFDYVIVYLGNNDGAAGVPKGYYSPFRARVADWFTQQPETRFRPVLSPPRFRFDDQVPSSTIATAPAEFRDNLRSIVRHAAKQRARVIIFNPVANHRFPCGLGAANSTYFCYLDNLDQLGYAPANEPVDKASEQLASGLRYFVSGDLEEAAGMFAPLASTNHNVAGFIARHNLACARARMGDDTSEKQLSTLLGEYRSYDSTVFYNLAQLKRWQGDEEAVGHLLDMAFENDTSVYRIRRAYRDVIAAFAPVNGVRVLDLEPILQSSDFVDYCHPTEEGHEKIAEALASLIRADERPTSRSERSRYEASFPTPNYFHHPGQTLLDYYCIDWPIDPKRIASVLAARDHGDEEPDNGDKEPDNRDDEIVKCVDNFFRSNAGHPIFTANVNLVGAWAPRSHEILSYPEYFLYRMLYNYSLAFEQDSLAERLSAAALLEQIRFSSADYEKLILRRGSDSLEANLDIRREYYDAIVKTIRQQLMSDGLMYRVAIGERVRTIMTWYTREAFRYGTQSRMSMLYARWEIEKVIEGLIVAIVIASRRHEGRELWELDRLLSHVLTLLQVHEQHVSQYHRDATTFSVVEYEAALAHVKLSIRSHIDPSSRIEAQRYGRQ
jgi:lysophospholipase L1-like esterase